MEAKTQTMLTQEASTIVERVARIVSSVRGTNPNYAHLATELEQTIPFDLFGIVLLRHDRQAVRVTICRREGEVWKSQYRQHPLAGSMLERVLEHPVITLRDCPQGIDGPPAESGDALSGFPLLHSTLIAPLMVGERVLGTLELGSTVSEVYGDETLRRLIDAIVQVLAAAIERTQLGGSVAIQDRQREALKDVSSALTTEMDLPGIFKRIVVGIGEALQLASAIVTWDTRTQRLHLEAQFGLDADILSTVIERTVGMSERSILGAALRRRQPCVSQDIEVDAHYPESQLFASTLGVRSVFSHPLVIGDKVFGVLLLCSREPGGFTPLKSDILSLFASQATIAIHNGILFESAKKRRRFQAAIEQLERAHIGIDSKASTYASEAKSDPIDLLPRDQSGISASESDSESDSRSVSDAAEVQALFERVCREAEQTFGIRLSSLLRFLTDHLLTQSERDLQTIVYAALESEIPAPPGSLLLLPTESHIRQESTALLLQTAEDALARAGLFGKVGAALTVAPSPLYEHMAHNSADARFLVELDGHCLYMNPAAEALCGMRTGGFALTLEEVFASILSRTRNASELLTYLRNFVLPGESDEPLQVPQREATSLAGARITTTLSHKEEEAHTLRCVIAAEPLQHSVKAYPPWDNASMFDPAGSTLLGKIFLERHNHRDQAYVGTQETPAFAPSDHHYQLIRTPLFDREGRLVAYALEAHDITEQVRDELNKSVLLSSVSHDLRTPLTTIKAAVTGLLQPGVVWDEEVRREILEEVDVETDHMVTLVNAFIDMSRIEMGALVLEKEWCDMTELVYGAISRLERVLAGHNVRTEFQPHLPLVQADYVQLERVFRNLLENAARHSPEQAEILLTLDVQNAMLRAQVIDQGSGIPEEERERIFQTFYALDAQGSGLGLAICRGIVGAHGGRIWVEPAPGKSGGSMQHAPGGTTRDETSLYKRHGDHSDEKQRQGSCFVFVLPLHS